MNIHPYSWEQVRDQLQRWHGKVPPTRLATGENMLQQYCDRYYFVQVASIQELSKLPQLKDYLVGGHSFYLYVHCPRSLADRVSDGTVRWPSFFFQAEDLFAKTFDKNGSLELIIGILNEVCDRLYRNDVMANVVMEEKRRIAADTAAQQEEANRIAFESQRAAWQAAVDQVKRNHAAPKPSFQAPSYQPAQTYQAPVYQVPQQPVYQQPAYQPPQQPAYQEPQRQAPQTEVQYFSFGSEAPEY